MYPMSLKAKAAAPERVPRPSSFGALLLAAGTYPPSAVQQSQETDGHGEEDGHQEAWKKICQRPAKPPKPIALYYWPTPNGQKISIVLEELGVPYESSPVNIGKGEQFAPAFLKISPNNRMPAIVDPDGPGGRPISVFESGAILQYLGRKYRPLLSRRTSAPGSQVEEWLFWQVGGLGPMAGQANHFLQLCRGRHCPMPRSATPMRCIACSG